MSILTGIQISKNSTIDELVEILSKVSPTSLIEFEEPAIIPINEVDHWIIACHIEVPNNADKDIVARTVWSSIPITWSIEEAQRYALMEAMKYCGAILVDEITPSEEALEETKTEEPLTEKQRIKILKTALGLKRNEEFNEHVREFSGGELSSIRDINSTNIKEFNDYLQNLLDSP